MKLQVKQLMKNRYFRLQCVMLMFVLGLLSLLMPGKAKTYYIHPSNSQTIDAKLSRIVRSVRFLNTFGAKGIDNTSSYKPFPYIFRVILLEKFMGIKNLEL